MTGEAFGLYTHIRNNRIRSRLLIAGLFLLAYLVSFAVILILTGMNGVPRGASEWRFAMDRFVTALPFVTAGVALWVFVGYRINVWMIGKLTGAQGLSRSEAPRLHAMLETLCISRGMRTPRLMIVEDPALNAFASGVNEDQYTVTVTRGLLDHLDEREIEAVLAHELTHIRNGDVRLMIVAVVIAGVISFVSEIMFRGFRFSGSSRSSSSGDNKGAGALILVGILILAVAGLLAAVIRFSLSRSREYLADAGAVELTKNPDAMISALLKISGRADLTGVPSGVMDMCFENDPDDMSDMFSTHPSISKRVQALVNTAGGRIPPAPPRVTQRPDLPSIVEARGPWGVRHPGFGDDR